MVDETTIECYAIVDMTTDKEWTMGCRSIGRLISILNRQAQLYLNTALQDLDIGSSEHIFLINLLKEDGISQEELSARLLIDKAATARALKSLEEKGYVRREADASDRRSKKVFCTEKALANGETLHGILRAWTALLTEGIPEEQAALAITLLEKMSDNARAAGHRIG